ncbi:MAG: helix-turn-helix transcriptional regulator [Clostridium sp.]|uniref:helix-turn-helix domain-containing protein n=1 Tax=Clostridium TaxID=1485 RepID=UPI0025C1A069|nr:helix-turn-helix transcriptional regulator [Clostridium sp.]MBS4958835.1 helix-turn-helix transcriptional regulator [Clostridium sp.]MDU1279161.1 helix-turn-helix transcriptional regulator [Clostridium sp.]
MFRTLRERAGLTTKYVAAKLNIKVTTLYKIEQHICLPSASILLEMKELYKCTYEEIMSCYKIGKEIKNERETRKRA